MSDSPATGFAAALLLELARLGVRDLVVAPGSRSQAFALVAAALDRAGGIRLRVRVDERSAGFLALGLARESGAPAAVVTTSGTAVANLHPAVLEAHHSGVPLIVITADRPEELHGIGANQTTEHVGMFGEAVRRTWDVGAPTGEPGEAEAARTIAGEVVAAARGAHSVLAAGPVHLNVAFAEPLSSAWEPPISFAEPSTGGASRVETAPALTARRDEGAGVLRARVLRAGARTAVIAGAGAGPRAEELARELGAVLFAEVVSGAHFGPNLVIPYREVIRDPAFLDGLERIVVLGRPTLSREVPWLIERSASAGVEIVAVRGPGAEDYNPGHAVADVVDQVVVEGELDATAARSWFGPWVGTSRAHLAQTEDVSPEVFAGAREKAWHELDAVRQPVTRRTLVEAVWRASWPHDRLVVASSRLVRVLDAWAPGKAIPVHANRGLAGIDGNASTAIGVALAQQSVPERGEAADGPGASSRAAGAVTGVTRLLTGDLAFLHDVGGLAFGVGEERPRILVIVGNYGGGTIIDGLEVAALAGADFDRVILASQTASIEGLARAYGWDYRRVETRGELDPALSTCTGPTVVEVPLAR